MSDNDDDDENKGKALKARKTEADGNGLDDLHVSFISKPAATSRRDKASVGPQGHTRVKVVKALRSLGNILRRRVFTSSIQVISRARVPIVKFETHLGFEGDIAMGGHNGTDTSKFAQSCVDRYKRYVYCSVSSDTVIRRRK